MKRRFWTEEEDLHMINGFRAKKRGPRISAELGRERQSAYHRLKFLEITVAGIRAVKDKTAKEILAKTPFYANRRKINEVV